MFFKTGKWNCTPPHTAGKQIKGKEKNFKYSLLQFQLTRLHFPGSSALLGHLMHVHLCADTTELSYVLSDSLLNGWLRLKAVCQPCPFFSYLPINHLCCNDLSDVLTLMKRAWVLIPGDRFLKVCQKAIVWPVALSTPTECEISCAEQPVRYNEDVISRWK